MQHGNIDSCLSTVGGIVGSNISEINVNNCYSTVNLQTDIGYIGGIEGREQKTNNSIQDSGNLVIRKHIL